MNTFWKRVFALAASTSAVLLVTSATPALAAARKPSPVTRIKLATIIPSGSSPDLRMRELAEQWRKLSGGAVDLELYAGGAMGDESDILRRIRSGQLQAGLLSVTGLAEIDPGVSALQFMPMVFRSWEEVDFIREKLRSRFEQNLRKKGYVVLFWTDAGWVRFFAKEPFEFPEELKRRKMFAWAGNSAQIDLMKALGYSPIPLGADAIFTGLKTDMINVVAVPPVYANGLQIGSAAPHMLDLKWAPIVGGAVVSAKVWDALPEATRRELARAALETGRRIQERTRKEDDEAIAAMAKRGLKIQPVTPEIEARWRSFTERIYPKIPGKIVPADVFNEVQVNLAQYRAAAAKTAKAGKNASATH